MRREFTRRSFVAASLAFLAAGCRSLNGLPPSYGEAVPTSYTVDDVYRAGETGELPIYVALARTYLMPYAQPDLDALTAAYGAELAEAIHRTGVIGLYQKCTHMGCKVPFCGQSQFWECPCHGARFTMVGEAVTDVQLRGMDLFLVIEQQGKLVIDTTSVRPGLPLGVNLTDQQPAGPYCVS